jgi:hypothetical protein
MQKCFATTESSAAAKQNHSNNVRGATPLDLCTEWSQQGAQHLSLGFGPSCQENSAGSKFSPMAFLDQIVGGHMI